MFKVLSQTLPGLTDKFFRKKGFFDPKLVTCWHDIVGQDLAAVILPEKLVTSLAKDGAKRGVLHLKVSPAFSLEAQHLEGVIVEKVNQFLGYKAVDRIMLQQAVMTQTDSNKKRFQPAKKQPINLEGFKDDNLQSSLEKLSQYVISDD